MDKSTHIPGGKEYTAEPITAQEMQTIALTVLDRVTGETYDPKEAFDRLMNRPETMAMLKRLAVR